MAETKEAIFTKFGLAPATSITLNSLDILPNLRTRDRAGADLSVLTFNYVHDVGYDFLEGEIIRICGLE